MSYIRTAHGTYWFTDTDRIVKQRKEPGEDGRAEFTIVYRIGSPIVAIKGFDGKYVCAEDGGDRNLLVCNRDNAYAWEEFELGRAGEGISLKACNGRFVCAEDDLKRVVVNRERQDAWETFHLTRSGNSIPAGDPTMDVAVRGKFFTRRDGRPLVLIGTSEFSLFKQFLDGQDVSPVLRERSSLGFNCLRVWLLNNSVVPGGIDPRSYPNFYTSISAFTDFVRTFGFNIEWTAFTQTQTLMPNVADQKRHWGSTIAALQGRPNVLLELVNEYDQHDNDCSNELWKPPGVISSHGSGGADQEGKSPIWDYTQYHTNDLSEWQRKVGHNAMELADKFNVPCYSNENMRYPDKESSLTKAFDAMAGAALLNAGGCFHSQSGKLSRLFDVQELAAARAWVEGAQSVPLQYQTGLYFNRSDQNAPGVIRTYERAIPGSSYRVEIRG